MLKIKTKQIVPYLIKHWISFLILFTSPLLYIGIITTAEGWYSQWFILVFIVPFLALGYPQKRTLFNKAFSVGLTILYLLNAYLLFAINSPYLAEDNNIYTQQDNTLNSPWKYDVTPINKSYSEEIKFRGNDLEKSIILHLNIKYDFIEEKTPVSYLDNLKTSTKDFLENEVTLKEVRDLNTLLTQFPSTEERKELSMSSEYKKDFATFLENDKIKIENIDINISFEY
jgi:hypothetical protein